MNDSFLNRIGYSTVSCPHRLDALRGGGGGGGEVVSTERYNEFVCIVMCSRCYRIQHCTDLSCLTREGARAGRGGVFVRHGTMNLHAPYFFQVYRQFSSVVSSTT